MEQQIEDVQRPCQCPGHQHPEFLPEVWLRDEWCEPEGQRGDDEDYQRLSVEPVHIDLPSFA